MLHNRFSYLYCMKWIFIFFEQCLERLVQLLLQDRHFITNGVISELALAWLVKYTHQCRTKLFLKPQNDLSRNIKQFQGEFSPIQKLYVTKRANACIFHLCLPSLAAVNCDTVRSWSAACASTVTAYSVTLQTMKILEAKWISWKHCDAF